MWLFLGFGVGFGVFSGCFQRSASERPHIRLAMKNWQNKNNNKLRGRRDRPQRRLVFQLMKFSFFKASLTASSGELQGPV